LQRIRNRFDEIARSKGYLGRQTLVTKAAGAFQMLYKAKRRPELRDWVNDML
jgi:hypothetical protein